jgi:hypothetical protein
MFITRTLWESRPKRMPRTHVRDALRTQRIRGRLIAARLFEDDHGVLRPTALAEATLRAVPGRRQLRWTA